MKTTEQIKTDVVNYLNKTSKHLFVDDKGNLFKVIFDENLGRYITIQGDRVDVSYITIDEKIAYYGSNTKCIIKHDLFLNKNLKSVKNFKVMRQTVKQIQDGIVEGMDRNQIIKFVSEIVNPPTPTISVKIPEKIASIFSFLKK